MRARRAGLVRPYAPAEERRGRSEGEKKTTKCCNTKSREARIQMCAYCAARARPCSDASFLIPAASTAAAALLSYYPPSPSPTTDEVPLSKALNSHPPGQRASHWESCWRPVSRRVTPCTCSFVFLKRIILLFYNLLEPEDGGEVLAAGGFQHRGQRQARYKDICWATPRSRLVIPFLDATLESVVLFYAFIHSLIDSLDKV